MKTLIFGDCSGADAGDGAMLVGFVNDLAELEVDRVCIVTKEGNFFALPYRNLLDKTIFVVHHKICFHVDVARPANGKNTLICMMIISFVNILLICLCNEVNATLMPKRKHYFCSGYRMD